MRKVCSCLFLLLFDLYLLWGDDILSDISFLQTTVAKNPSYIGLQKNIEFLFSYREKPDIFSLKLGGLELRRDEIRKLWGFGLGGGLSERFYWGLRYYYDDKWKFYSYTGGAVFYPVRNIISLGLTVSPKDDYYGFGVAFRPKTKMLTLFGDIFTDERFKINKGLYKVGAQVEPMRGLKIFGAIDKNKKASFGFAFQFSNLRVWGGASDDKYNSLFQVSSVEFPSFVSFKAKALNITLSSSIEENPGSLISSSISHYELVSALHKASKSKDIEKIFIDISDFSGNLACAEEIRNGILDARKNGKKVIVYANSLGNVGYYLASSADMIIVPPSGSLYIYGLRMEIIFLKGLFDKLGVKAEFVSIGKYKSASETFTRTEMSEYAREENSALLDELYEHIISSIACGRKLDADSVRKLVDEGIYDAQSAKLAGLVDTVLYLDDAKKIAGENFVELNRFAKKRFYNENWGPHEKIAILYAKGAIVDERGGIPLFGSENVVGREYVKIIDKLEKRKDIKGVVLRVDSPGGSALASDIILNSLRKLSKKKPVVVSMGTYAASGGYMISSVSGKIFADYSTITGSIGVITGKFALKGLYDKIGITIDTLQRGKSAAMFSMYDTLSPDLLNKFKDDAEYFYKRFVELVANGRNLPYDSVLSIAEGRIYTGASAKKLGLVDSIGGIYDAVNFVAEKKNISRDFSLEYFPRKRNIIESLLLSLFSQKFNLFYGNSIKNLIPFRTCEPLYIAPYLLKLE